MPNPDYHRRSIRLPGYDYSKPGAYFVTLVKNNLPCPYPLWFDFCRQYNSGGDSFRSG